MGTSMACSSSSALATSMVATSHFTMLCASFPSRGSRSTLHCTSSAIRAISLSRRPSRRKIDVAESLFPGRVRATPLAPMGRSTTSASDSGSRRSSSSIGSAPARPLTRTIASPCLGQRSMRWPWMCRAPALMSLSMPTTLSDRSPASRICKASQASPWRRKRRHRIRLPAKMFRMLPTKATGAETPGAMSIGGMQRGANKPSSRISS
mmetsp:Transcript_3130/g.6312  ORF Transcript_3130/g.6312 Transcript_3130/m.6312 type:complete len:208 (-) Transcript_3130:1472-2095(-)